MNQDSGIPLTSLKVDGGMTANSLLMQIQADLLGIPVGRIVYFLDCYQPRAQGRLPTPTAAGGGRR